MFAKLIMMLDNRRGTSSERGATAVEYGLLVALIAAVIIGVVILLGGDVTNAFESVEDNLGGNGNAPVVP